MSLYTSLVAYWQMSEASGSRADSIGSSTLTDNNTVTSNTGIVHPLAADFLFANSEYLSAADNAALSMGDIDFWVAVWVQFPAKGANQAIVAKWDQVGNKKEYEIFVSASRFTFAASSDGTASTSINADSHGSPANNVWHLVIGWHDSVANTINISVDGGSVDSAAHTTGVLDDVTEFRMGAAVSLGGLPAYLTGRIGPVMIGKGYVPTGADRIWLYDEGRGRTLDEFASYDAGLGASESPPGKFDIWLNRNTPFQVLSPASGDTGTFDTWLTATQPFTVYVEAVISGTASITLADATLAATGTLAITGVAAPTLGDVTLIATGTVAIVGTAAVTLDAATLAATGTVAIAGTANVTLADATLAATGTLAVVGVANVTLADATLLATGTLSIAGLAAITLSAVTLSSAGTVAILGAATITLADVTLVASNVVVVISVKAGTVYGPRATSDVYGPSAIVTVEA